VLHHFIKSREKLFQEEKRKQVNESTVVLSYIMLLPYKAALDRPLEKIPGHMPLLHVLLDDYMMGSMCQGLVIKYALTTFLPYIPGNVDEFLQLNLFVRTRALVPRWIMLHHQCFSHPSEVEGGDCNGVPNHVASVAHTILE
jgi:hypothetical protein